jgi:hypothetical protein
MMHSLFNTIAHLLQKIAELTGLTYNEINIIVYYILVPFTWMLLLDKIRNTFWFSLTFGAIVLGALLLIKDFWKFSDILFEKSVDFLNWFEIIGSNYILSSVIICVFIPLAIYVMLFYFAFNR